MWVGLTNVTVCGRERKRERRVYIMGLVGPGGKLKRAGRARLGLGLPSQLMHGELGEVEERDEGG
jgi:hypothetical protein